MRLTPEKQNYFCSDLRTARAKALSDAEGFSHVLFAIERLGGYISGGKRDLGKHKESLKELASQSPLAEAIPTTWDRWFSTFDTLFDLVREARNDALHQGAFARHLTMNEIKLALILEDALSREYDLLRDFMVANPVCAYPWQPLALVRQQMLANLFTYLPIWIETDSSLGWHLIADAHLAACLRSGIKDRKELLAMSVVEAYHSKLLELAPASICRSDTRVAEVIKEVKESPILVVDDEKQDILIGIVTAFDLL